MWASVHQHRPMEGLRAWFSTENVLDELSLCIVGRFGIIIFTKTWLLTSERYTENHIRTHRIQVDRRNPTAVKKRANTHTNLGSDVRYGCTVSVFSIRSVSFCLILYFRVECIELLWPTTVWIQYHKEMLFLILIFRQIIDSPNRKTRFEFRCLIPALIMHRIIKISTSAQGALNYNSLYDEINQLDEDKQTTLGSGNAVASVRRLPRVYQRDVQCE